MLTCFRDALELSLKYSNEYPEDHFTRSRLLDVLSSKSNDFIHLDTRNGINTVKEVTYTVQMCTNRGTALYEGSYGAIGAALHGTSGFLIRK